MKQIYRLAEKAININLMQNQRKQQVSKVVLPLIFIMIYAAVFSGCGWLWMEGQNKLTDVKRQLHVVSQESSVLETKLSQSSMGSQLSEILVLPEQLRVNKPLTTELITQINKLLPDLINVTQLELDNQGVLKLTVHSVTTENLISLSQSIQNSENFKLVEMGTINSVSNDIVQTVNRVDLSAIDIEALTLPIYQTTMVIQYGENR